MNIFEQEDLIKGLPDQALMQEAQRPSGQLPQYLVVSEIQRRQDMRKRFSKSEDQPAQGTVKEQILSGGIADIGQQPPGQPPQQGPGMPPPQGGMPPQGPMPQQTGMPPQPPMGMPQQPPMPMPQQMPMPPQPPMGMPPQGMAAGGVIRMFEGRDTPYVQDLLAFSEKSSPINDQIGDLERAAAGLYREEKSQNIEDRLGLQDQIADIYDLGPGKYSVDEKREALLAMASPEEITEAGDRLGLNPNFVQNVVSGTAISTDAQRLNSPLATKVDSKTAVAAISDTNPESKVSSDLNNMSGFGNTTASRESLLSNIDQLSNIAKLDPTSRASELVGLLQPELEGEFSEGANSVDESVTDPTSLQSLIEEMRGSKIPSVPAAADYSAAKTTLAGTQSIRDKLTSETSGFADLINKIEKPSMDFSSFMPDYSKLISEAERRADKIKEDARKDAGAQALMQLGAGIAEGSVSEGLRGASKVTGDIMRQARSEASAESTLARRMEMAGKEAQMNLGLKGQQAAIDDYDRQVGLLSRDYGDQRARELTAAGMDSDAAIAKAGLEMKAAEALYAQGQDQRTGAIDLLVKQAAILRYQDLEKQSGRSLNKAILQVVKEPLETAFDNWSAANPEATPEAAAEYLEGLVGRFITLDSAAEQGLFTDPMPSQSGAVSFDSLLTGTP